MEVLHSHCAGLDVHKDTVVACVRATSGSAALGRDLGTTTKDLLAHDWLSSTLHSRRE